MYKINRFIASSIPEDRSQTYIHSQIQSVQNNEQHQAYLCVADVGNLNVEITQYIQCNLNVFKYIRFLNSLRL